MEVTNQQKLTKNGNIRKTRSDRGLARSSYTVSKIKGINCGMYSRQNLSMKFGPKTSKMPWMLIQQPAIYEIVCKSSKRRYIGCSTRPDLRRAVHYFWLQNHWKFGTSNVFFGNVALARDVEKYGVDDFYLEIIQSFPGLTTAELKEEEDKFLRTMDIKKIYNKKAYIKDNQTTSAHFAIGFCEIEPEVDEAYKVYMKARKNRDRFEVAHKEFMSEKTIRRSKIKDLKDRGLLTPTEYKKMYDKISITAKARQREFIKITKELKEASARLRNLINSMRLKYENATHCLY